MKQFAKKLLLPVSVSMVSFSAFADHQEENSQLQDAWLDGKIGTVVLFNEHLNPFDIETDVVDGKAIVTGRVDSDVQKDLMTELALSVEGIHEVDNRLVVSKEDDNESELKKTMIDASITTAISTKLLLNTEINSLKIDVDTNDRRVVLEGTVENEIEKELVGQIASNTSNVEEVINRLKYTN